MISVRRADQRQYEHRRKREAWLTFDAHDAKDPLAHGFGRLVHLDEERLPPGAHVLRHPREAAELITYVLEGTLSWQDSMGRTSILHAGEIQRLGVVRGLRHGVTNLSRTDDARAIQAWLRTTDASLEPGLEQKRFSLADRRDGLCLVASPDARNGSLRLHQDTLVYAAMLDQGQHVVHELAVDHVAWLHVVTGGVAFEELNLSAGDGAGLVGERSISLTATESSEILVLDLGNAPVRQAVAPSAGAEPSFAAGSPP